MNKGNRYKNIYIWKICRIDMNYDLFRNLRKEIRESYGITKDSITFIPFEGWRTKLRAYPKEFEKEYSKNLLLLKRKLGLTDLPIIENPDKKLILFTAIPGAGKTTLSNMIIASLPNTILIRGHDIVNMLHLYQTRKGLYQERLKEKDFEYPDPWYISYVYQEGLTGSLLDSGYNVVFDDHIRTRINRLGYDRFAERHGAKTIFIQINASLKTFLEREEGKTNIRKAKFLANFIFQSEDFSDAERRRYDKVIQIDGTLSLKDIRKTLISKIIS